MISFDKIEKWSLGYQIYKDIVDFAQRNFYYKNFIVNGLENIQPNQPVIYAPNHQNALMDALAVLAAKSKFQPVFLARADIFKKDAVAKFLRYIKIMPVYRIRDGVENLANNDEIFDQCVRIISQKKPIIILPEGNHEGFRQLRPLKKGLARIAFKAAELSNFELNVTVVPIGLEYSQYNKFRQNVIVNIGKPIPISDFKETFVHNQAMAVNKFTNRLSKEMIPLMIHISDKENYDMYDELRKIACKNMLEKLNLYDSISNSFKAEKSIIQHIETISKTDTERFQKLKEKTTEYTSNLKLFNLRDWLFSRNSVSIMDILGKIIILLILSPLFVYGFLLNILPFHIPVRAVRKIQDIQFHSSVKFGLGTHLFTFYYLFLFGLSFIFIPFWWLSFLFLVSMPISGLIAFWYYKVAKKCNALGRYKNLLKTEELQKTKQLRNEIIELLRIE